MEVVCHVVPTTVITKVLRFYRYSVSLAGERLLVRFLGDLLGEGEPLSVRNTYIKYGLGRKNKNTVYVTLKESEINGYPH